MTNQSTSERSFFDLHITGLGYLNRIRDVKPPKGSKGDTYLACDIGALCGPTDDVSYVRFTTRVSGSDAQHLVRRCKEAVDANKKVMVGFKLGDLRGEIFTHSSGEKAGQQGVALRARLLFIDWIKVDGVLKYKAEPRKAQEQDAAEGSAAPSPQAPKQAAAPKAPDPVVEPDDEPADEREPALADSF